MLPHDYITVSSTRQVLTLPLCKVLLNDDKTWPWLVLVPQQNDLVEMHDLSDEDQLQLMKVRASSTLTHNLHTRPRTHAHTRTRTHTRARARIHHVRA